MNNDLLEMMNDFNLGLDCNKELLIIALMLEKGLDRISDRLDDIDRTLMEKRDYI